MKTKHKIALAKAAYRAISLGRRFIGRTDTTIVVRRGIRYELDLAEGIDLAIYLQGQFEPTTAAACARYVRTGYLALDIGANIGAHTLSLARLVGDTGKVVAFEPTAYAFAKLNRNLALNTPLASRVTAFQCFLGPTSDGDAPQTIYASWPLVGRPALHPQHGGASSATRGARKVSLDQALTELGHPRVDFVKMDVDGYECDVLAGAWRVMARDRPVFVMELAPYVLAERGASVDALVAHFLPLGYHFYRERDEARLPDDLAAFGKLVASGESINIVAKVDSRPI